MNTVVCFCLNKLSNVNEGEKMKKLLLAFLLMPASIFSAAGADVKKEGDVVEQADKWAKEVLKGLTDLEQIVLIEEAYWIYKDAVSQATPKPPKLWRRGKGKPLGSKELKSDKVLKIFEQMQQDLKAMQRGESQKLPLFKYKFLQLKKNSTVPEAFKVQIYSASGYPDIEKSVESED